MSIRKAESGDLARKFEGGTTEYIVELKREITDGEGET